VPKGRSRRSSGSSRLDQLVRAFRLPDRAALGHALDRAASAYWAAVNWGTGSEDGAAEADALDELGKVLKPAAAALSEMADAQRQGGERMDEHTYEVLILALEDGDPAMTEQEAEAWLNGLTLDLARLDRVVAAIPRQRYGQGAPHKNEAAYAMIMQLAQFWESLGRRFQQSQKPDGGSAFVRAAIPLVVDGEELPAPEDSAVRSVIKQVVAELRKRRLRREAGFFGKPGRTGPVK
jgi:hypothetical protein